MKWTMAVCVFLCGVGAAASAVPALTMLFGMVGVINLLMLIEYSR